MIKKRKGSVNIMTTNDMKTVLFNKLCDENCNFAKSDISIREHNNNYKIIIKDYEHLPFLMSFDNDDYFGYIVYIYCYDDCIVFVDSKKEFDIKTALIQLGYYIGTRF